MMRRWGAVFLLLVGCAPSAETPVQECRRRAAYLRFKGDRTAETVQELRCDAMEEREDNRRRDREHATATQDAQEAARLAKIRSAPRVPELGAGYTEVKLLCEQQSGTLTQREDALGCSVGGAGIFAVVLDANTRGVTSIDAYYENADLAAARDRVAQALGPPERVGHTADGSRAFVWRHDTIFVTTYPHGVRVTTVKSPP